MCNDIVQDALPLLMIQHVHASACIDHARCEQANPRQRHSGQPTKLAQPKKDRFAAILHRHQRGRTILVSGFYELGPPNLTLILLMSFDALFTAFLLCWYA